MQLPALKNHAPRGKTITELRILVAQPHGSRFSKTRNPNSRFSCCTKLQRISSAADAVLDNRGVNLVIPKTASYFILLLSTVSTVIIITLVNFFIKISCW